MALVTVQRSPCRSASIGNCHYQPTDETDGTDGKDEGDEKAAEKKKNISECYFAVKGAALVLPHDECLHVYGKAIANGVSDIQQHLQAMFYLLHPNDILKMAVKLESIHPGRTRYLVVVSRNGKQQTEESCLLGIDCNSQTTIGLVLPVWADTRITLDGDGGFSVTSSGRHHIFKPVSVQAMWSALQTLHKASSKAREYNYFKCGGTHQWTEYYEKNIASDRSCLNEWHAMDDIESRRPPSPDTLRSQPTERDETERHIRTKLKELMMSVDLDEVTSKYIRTRLEEILDMNLKEYKSFIDQEMLTILGQMDAPTEIFQYLYLGSEWNASNLEELKVNGIGHILNVTREIDNFFPGMFDYQNVRVYDDESTEILHYWDKTYRYIRRAKDEGSKVLVHCKMGISRSASVVIAYVMKAYDWNLQQALDFVKTKRNCIKPNSGFLKQLETYQGILDASKQRHNSLWRSKSETNLKSTEKPKKTESEDKKDEMPTKSVSMRHLKIPGTASRPKSWSPNDAVADELFPPNSSLSNETLAKEENFRGNKQSVWQRKSLDPFVFVQDSGTQHTTVEPSESEELKVSISSSTKNPDSLRVDAGIPRVSSIKDRINELELHATAETKTSKSEVKSPTSQSRSGLVLNLATQFESVSKPSSPVDEGLTMVATAEEEIVEPVLAQMKPPAGNKHHAVLVKPSVWPSDENFLKPLADPDRQLVEMAYPKTADATESCSKKSPVPDESEVYSKKLPEALETTASVPAARSLNNVSPAGNTCDLQVKKILDHASKSSHCVQDTSSKLHHTDDSIDDILNAEEICNTLKNTNSILLSDVEEKSHSCVLKLQIDGKAPVINQCTGSLEDCESLLLADSHIKTEHLPAKSVGPGLPQCDASAYSSSNSHNVPSKSEHFYEKEDIPFTPGTVQRTKQQIEEKNLTRTTSFDSGFPIHPHSTPSSPPDCECGLGKPVQRSHSLRNERRPTSMFAGKWVPLPALASPLPKLLHGSREKLGSSHRASRKENTMVHSMSTPSVVEAVNQVMCRTQVLCSAIQSLPLDGLSCQPSSHPNHLSSSSSLDFGSVTSLSDMEVSDIVFGVKNPTVHSESPVPGIVRQQREILENKNPRFPASEKNAKVNQLSNSLVSSNSSAKMKDNSDFGIVKRLTKELEAKASTKIEKEKSGDDLAAAESPKDDKDRSQCVWSSPERDSSLGGTPDWEGHHPARSRPPIKSATENLPPSDSLHVAPPTPHRKGSLDHNCLRKTSQSPLTIKLSSQLANVSTTEPADVTRNISSGRTLIRQNCLHRTSLGKDCQCQTDSTNGSQKTTSNRPPAAVKVHHGFLSDMPPPPPPPPPPPIGPPRKVRKQQGSTHPLSKLTVRQRHVNPMYNTM